MPTCPTCKRELAAGAEAAAFPFCTPRCKLVDLHGWLNDRYVVSDALPIDDEVSFALTDAGASFGSIVDEARLVGRGEDE